MLKLKRYYIIGVKKMKQYNKNGFTLIELMVAIAIFVLVMSTASGIFILALRHQEKALAKQELLSQTSFIIEYMSRGIRMAKRQRADRPVCVPIGLNFETPASNHIRFLKWDHLASAGAGGFVCYEFFLDTATHRLMKRRAGGIAVPLTSAKLEVIRFRVNIIGDASPEEIPPEQPKVTIALEIRGRGRTEQERPQIYFQTTVSQRDLDI